MKKIHLLLLSLCMSIVVHAQTQSETYLWPVEGASPGTNILYAPQSYIDMEHNFGNLFIGAAEGTTVLSPVDGTITHISLSYLSSLTYSSSMRYNGSFDESLLKARSDFDKTKDPKYLGGFLGIRAKDGKMIYINGLSGSQNFKTGQTVQRGEPIGKVAYSYHKIKEPSISLSISMNTQSSDPMSPFGIKSTYKAPEEMKPIVSLTPAQAKEDFMVYINALKEAFPGLYDVVTKEELEQYISQTLALIDSYKGDLKFKEYEAIIDKTLAKIHDSHIYPKGVPWKRETTQRTMVAPIVFGFIQDTLVCRNATEQYENLIGRPIKSVNGWSADSIRKAIESGIAGYDAKVQSFVDYNLVYAGNFSFMNFGTDLDVEFANGEKYKFTGVSAKDAKFNYTTRAFSTLNRYRKGYFTIMANDSTAYLGLSTFNLNQVQVENIGTFIDSVSDKKIPYLIIDVRNNNGGEGEVIYKLYSFIAGEPFSVDGYSKVNKRHSYKCFNQSYNRMEQDSLFLDYVQENGKDGYYLRPENKTIIQADSAINYKGRVYVLTNELSVSAATMFPALLIRNHRGVVVGRETRTAYHFMNAVKFVDMRLPNSLMTITIPLVHNVFDTVVNERVPYGRGALPDYSCLITIDELSYKNGDAILNYAMELIKEGQYLKGDNPFK